MKKIYLMFVCLICICIMCACSNKQETVDVEPTVVIKSEQSENSVNECENPHESELIEEALVEQGYFNDLIPLDYDLQAELRAACDEFDVPFSLMVAMIDKESNFENIVGDSGNAEGYLQIWSYWHSDKMEQIGATDLMNPVDNFRTGCYIMSILLDKHTPYDALSAYNTGSVGYSEYAEVVSELWNYWEDVL